MSLRFSFKRMIHAWLFSLGIFGFLALLLAGQFSFSSESEFQKSLLISIASWLPWALVAPLLFWLAFVLPIDRATWKTALPVHVMAGILTLTFVILLGESISPMPHHRGGHPPPPPPQFGSDDDDPDDFRPPMPGSVTELFFHLRIRLPIYLAIISIAHALYFYRLGQEKEHRSLALEASLAKARLETLRLQLQPHFLFNSLNSIAELIHKDPEAADGMVVALSDLLRAALETSGTQELPLCREVGVLEKYLSIEKVRLGNRLETAIQIPPKLKKAMVPTLLLQPIVENAVRHGLEPKPGTCKLAVQANRRGKDLLLTVSDNGLGLPEGKIIREGIGLGNTRQRLLELYGEEASIKVQKGDNDKGVTVEIILPFHETV